MLSYFHFNISLRVEVKSGYIHWQYLLNYSWTHFTKYVLHNINPILPIHQIMLSKKVKWHSLFKHIGLHFWKVCIHMWQSVYLCLVGGGGPSAELPLSQPPQPTPPSSAANTLRTNSCPGTPDMQRRREEAVKRLAAKVQLKPTLVLSIQEKSQSKKPEWRRKDGLAFL